jgi:hypothetical protein
MKRAILKRSGNMTTRKRKMIINYTRKKSIKNNRIRNQKKRRKKTPKRNLFGWKMCGF